MHCGINAQYLAAAAQNALRRQRRILRSAGAKYFAVAPEKCVEYRAVEWPNTLWHWRRIGAVPAQNTASKWQKFQSATAQTTSKPRRRPCPSGTEDIHAAAQNVVQRCAEYLVAVAQNSSQ